MKTERSADLSHFQPPVIKGKSIIYLFFTVFLLLFFSSCTLEQKIGQKFVREAVDNYAIMLIPPDYLFKTNLKSDQIPGFKNMNQREKDSALIQNSMFIKDISDSIFMANYTSGLKELLTLYGIKLFAPSDFDAFLNHKGQNYVVTLAQIELEEYQKVITTEEILGEDDLYHEEFFLNALNVNSWFEVTRLNDTTDTRKHVLYASHYIFDNFESRLVENPFTGDVLFKYSIDSINVKSIHEFARFLGLKYAGYLYDYFMNAYIYEKYPAEREPTIYLHYDHKRRITYSAENDRFIFMD